MVNNSLVDQPPGSAVPVAVVESVTFLGSSAGQAEQCHCTVTYRERKPGLGRRCPR